MIEKIGVAISEPFKSPWGTTADRGVGSLVSVILSNSIVIAGVIMFVLILIGGIGIISSAGSNDPQGAAKGQKMISGAVIGFLLIFASYWIIQIIEEITGLNILNPGL